MSRLWIVLSLSSALVGCGAADGKNPAWDGGGPDKGPPTKTPILLLAFTPENPKVGETIRITASLEGATSNVFSWMVVDPNEQPTGVVKAGVAAIEVPGVRLGGYAVSCRAALDNGQFSDASVYPSVRDPSAPTWSHVAQIIPPPGTSLPPYNLLFTVEGADVPGQEWVVDQGVSTAPWKVRYQNVGINAFVRIFDPPADPRDIYIPAQGVTIASVDKIDILVLPESTQAVPGDVVASAKPSGASCTVDLTPGVPVTGKVTTDPAQGVAGATVVLYSQHDSTKLDVPSTLGTTDAAGAFQVLRRPGKATLVVTPPGSSGLPGALVKDLPATLGSTGWSLTYSKVSAPLDLGGQVFRADKVTPAAGARVELSLESSSMVGSLTVAGATGSFAVSAWQHRRSLISDGQGKLVDPKGGSLKVPAGLYRAEVWPGSGEPAEQGYALAKGLDPGKLVLALRKRVELTGQVAKADVRTKLLVSAVSPVGHFFTTTGSDGRFTLLIDDEASYSLTARAIGTSSRRVAAYVVPRIDIKGQYSLQPFDLPQAVVHKGVLKRKNGSAVGGALIRVYCNDAQACPTKPLVEEARSQDSGAFELRIPLPVAP